MVNIDEKLETPRWAELLKDAVTKPGTVSEAYGRFWNYSLGNQLLAMWQCQARGIELGPIATYPAWQEMGRHVKKGAKAITLCMPVTGKRTERRTDEQTGSEVETEIGFTRFVYRRNWFVLAQTEGAEYRPAPIPGWDQDAALAALQVAMVPFEMADGNCQGYAAKRTVAISPIAEHPQRTLLHELGHIVLGHTSEASFSDDWSRTPRCIREMEAEGVAMLCCAALGLPGIEESRGYIQSWFSGSEVPEKSAQRIFHAADQILKAGRVEVARVLEVAA